MAVCTRRAAMSSVALEVGKVEIREGEQEERGLWFPVLCWRLSQFVRVEKRIIKNEKSK